MIAALSFLLSFCSLGYQQVLALTVSDAIGDFVLSQAISLGSFLLGMGIGAARCPRRDPWFHLLTVEWKLALSGFVSVGYVLLCEIVCRLLGWQDSVSLLAFVLPYILWLGYLTGFELPLLLQIPSSLKPGHILAAGYSGAFIATVSVPLVFLPNLDVTGTSLALGLVNFLVAAFLLSRTRVRWGQVASIIALGLILLGFTQIVPRLADLHLKSVYFSPKISSTAELAGSWRLLKSLESPLRIRTLYQWIDVLKPEFSSAVQGRQDFQLYMNRKLQVSAGSSARYHESMAHGAVNLLGREPQTVLILGGGDGLLAHELLRYEKLARIDLVELDPQVLGLARELGDLNRLNQDALRDSRVRVHVGDAFQFVRESNQIYDLVLIDLPFPNSYDLSLLFTQEFYALTRQRLVQDGMVLLDFPLPGGRNSHLATLAKTLRSAGWPHLFAFGVEDFFVAASHRPLAFDFETLIPQVSNQTLINLLSRADELERAEGTSARVNSVLFPVHFGAFQ